MIPVLGTGGPGFNSRIAPFLFNHSSFSLITTNQNYILDSSLLHFFLIDYLTLFTTLTQKYSCSHPLKFFIKLISFSQFYRFFINNSKFNLFPTLICLLPFPSWRNTRQFFIIEFFNPQKTLRPVCEKLVFQQFLCRRTFAWV
jgi:hypothetical protein